MKQAIDFIKMNLAALACGVVALAAIIALFVWPVPGLFAELRTQVEDRKKTYDSLTALNNATRPLPNVDPSSGTEPPSLAAFPTQSAIKDGEKAIDQLKAGAKEVLTTIVAMNKRDPLVRDALPNPQNLARNYFVDAYRIVTAQYGENADKGIIRTILHGTLPPTQEELTAIEAAATNEIRKNNLQTDSRGVAQNQAQVDALVNDMKSKVVANERARRARAYKIYVSQLAVEIHPAMATVTGLDAKSIFNAQFSLWLQMTVLEAIDDANKGPKNVLDAPIKHLVKLIVPMNIAELAGGTSAVTGGEGGAAAPAVELKPDATADIKPAFARDPLGYASNAMYDPINVQMTLRIDATRLSESLAALTRTHLIKIRKVDLQTVDVGAALAQGFVYSRDGATPLVEVDLDCDVLVLREWLVRYMPDEVKAVFNSLANPPAAAQ